MSLYYDSLLIAEGELVILISEQGLRYVGVGMPESARINPTNEKVQKNTDKVAPYISQIKGYLTGESKQLTLPLDIGLIGTPFQKLVWQTLSEIPYGRSLTYEALAIKIGRPKAVRAVGTAVGKNPVLLQIPCHRVSRKDRTLGGYAGGLELKRTLLQLEGSLYQDK